MPVFHRHCPPVLTLPYIASPASIPPPAAGRGVDQNLPVTPEVGLRGWSRADQGDGVDLVPARGPPRIQDDPDPV
ncbi:hypothetical protein P0O15_12165 [Methanotrichaceae archaeon Mx]|uniref:Uncharacterized protein n=1 Tax=Candidatus Methanocrinis natronophilus TaxID=3033396 RepID=A0ABT5XBJ6_9EURY|nr:hypothetical protein [Candidatus Methanocrinis natronophilus]